jgi:hypothetical protein
MPLHIIPCQPRGLTIGNRITEDRDCRRRGGDWSIAATALTDRLEYEHDFATTNRGRMFLTELSPLLRECLAQPIAFVGGVVAGALRLNLQDEPVRTWLAKQGTAPVHTAPTADHDSAPQSIDIE